MVTYFSEACIRQDKSPSLPCSLNASWFPESVIETIVVTVDCYWLPVHQIHILLPRNRNVARTRVKIRKNRCVKRTRVKIHKNKCVKRTRVKIRKIGT